MKTSDENGDVAERGDDVLGRVTAVWQPGQDRTKNDPPVRKFSYAMNGTNAASPTAPPSPSRPPATTPTP
ncbi:hypothetical protein ACFYYS_31590 [Streptomyces sp. NPDC002120]|uniref:hypothetical protein n=1 Tax=Streptomyces sp. NPDC002120 TaxID=3364631 RepID=UPI0036C0804A